MCLFYEKHDKIATVVHINATSTTEKEVKCLGLVNSEIKNFGDEIYLFIMTKHIL